MLAEGAAVVNVCMSPDQGRLGFTSVRSVQKPPPRFRFDP